MGYRYDVFVSYTWRVPRAQTMLELAKALEPLVRGCPEHDPAWTVTVHADPQEPHVDRQVY